jgi:Tol biopolymer transport system component
VVAGAPQLGPPEQLTNASDQEITPSVAPDGRIAYAALRLVAATQTTAAEAQSRVEVRMLDGSTTALTEGPGDSAPTFSPDGAQVAWTRPEARARGVDADLWVMPSHGGGGTKVIDLPGTDETGPVWSRDGRYLFATSLLRGADGRPLFSSVIFVERAATPRVARVLIDRVGAVTRLTPTLSEVPLRDAILRQRPEYRDTLRDVIRQAIERAGASAPATKPSSPPPSPPPSSPP